jgi:hypothetical protein
MNDLKSFLTSRFTQLGMRYLAVFLVAKLGYDQAAATSAVTVLVQLAVALCMFVADIAIHYMQKKQSK